MCFLRCAKELTLHLFSSLITRTKWISLLSIPSKCQEKIIHQAIFAHVAPYLNDWQHGFIMSQSSITQQVLSHHQWTKALDARNQVDEVFLDLSKSFDKVSHVILLQNLCNFGVSGCLLNWCKDYFMNHEQQVVLYLFTYKPILAISRDPKLFHFSSCCIEIKNKHKTFGYKPRPNNCKVLHACR